jgi:hypothetical protein
VLLAGIHSGLPNTEDASGAPDTQNAAYAPDAQNTAGAEEAQEAQKAANTVEACVRIGGARNFEDLRLEICHCSLSFRAIALCRAGDPSFARVPTRSSYTLERALETDHLSQRRASQDTTQHHHMHLVCQRA